MKNAGSTFCYILFERLIEKVMISNMMVKGKLRGGHVAKLREIFEVFRDSRMRLIILEAYLLVWVK